MTAETDEQVTTSGVTSGVREAVRARFVVMLSLGVLTGYSVSVLGTDAVVLPVVGAVPGPVLGIVGLTVAAVAYRRTGGCGDCGQKACGCTGSCGDSCSCES